MNSIHDTLQRESERYDIPLGAFDRLTRRRNRRRRNERIAALVVGLAIAIGIVAVGAAMLRSAHEPKPGKREHPDMLHDREVLEVADDGATLVATDTVTGAQRTIACTDCPQLSEFALSPDGRWIAYVTACGGACPQGHGLWTVGAGQPPVRATSAEESWAWSPSAGLLAFVERHETADELALLDPATGERTTIVTTPWISALAWSPDGTQLAFAGPPTGIRVVDLGTGESTSIGPAGRFVDNMSWSPDGMRLAFDESIDGRSRIRVVNVDGSDDRIIVEGGLSEGPGRPAWSPDGTRIAYVTTPRDMGACCAFVVWVIGADGSDAIRLFHHGCCLDGPDWGSDGITDSDGPVWSPDGSRIAFWNDGAGSGTWLTVTPDGTGSPERLDGVVAETWEQGR